ncbi:Hypothetical protein A7982_02241 [Minicystis rosea]|nr:Hypothetical protein A7982_02241 [Minicystis rosea]
MSTASPRQTTVRTLSIRGSGRDALADRLRVERLLGAMDLHPPSLPPAAILCVRRLVDPRPGALALDGASMRPPRAWEDALVTALDALVRRAEKPARGVVSAAAEAVIFDDRAELLACLAQDFLRGEIGARWWWASLLPDVASPRAVVRAWLAAPEHVPGALHLAAERGNAAAFMRALAPADIEAFAHAISDRFGVPALIAAVSETRSLPPDTRLDAPHMLTAARLQAPWSPWTPELHHEPLDPAPAALLGFALALHRAPPIARSLRFADDVRDWSRTIASADLEAIATIASTPHEHTQPVVTAPRSPSDVDANAATLAPFARVAPLAPDCIFAPLDVRSTLDPLARTGHPLAPTLHDPARAPASPPHIAAHPDAPASITSSPALPASREPALTSSAPTLPAAPSFAPKPPELSSPDSTSSQPTAVPAEPALPLAPLAPSLPPFDVPQPSPRRFGAPVTTAFGGAFFLVNIGQNLGLYGDFSTPLTPGIDLSIWDFVALVGRDLAGDPFTLDPIWHLLADLAGRAPGAAPGASFVPEDVWRIPAAWLRPFRKAEPWSWSIGAGRLVVRHPSGFVVIDVAADIDPSTQVMQEASAYGAVVEPAADDAPPSLLTLDGWLAHLLPYVRARLARAVGPDVRDPGRLVTSIPARVHVTATHVDVVMSLADLPIEARLAGLDRDPGWVPAASRYVAFHFA